MPPKGAAHNSLRLEGLSFLIRLGCSEEERRLPQEVRISLEVRFPEAPLGTLSDKLEETVCYGMLADGLRAYFNGREFSLVEKVAQEAFQILREFCPRTLVAVEVEKVRPPVEGLRGGAIFRCGDFAS